MKIPAMLWLGWLLPILIFPRKENFASGEILGCKFHYNSNNKYYCFTHNFNMKKKSRITVAGLHLGTLQSKDVDGLQILNCDNNYIPEDVYWYFTNLKELHYICYSMDKSGLLDDSVYRGLFAYASELTEIYWSGHMIYTMPGYVFEGAKKLRTLSLNANVLTYIHKDAFQGIREVNSLSLGNNLFTYDLPLGIFDGLPNLRHLMLFSTNMKKLQKDLFRHNTQLQDLDLRNNKFISIEVEWSKLSNLQALNILDNICVSKEFNKGNMGEVKKYMAKCAIKTKIAENDQKKINGLSNSKYALDRKLKSLKSKDPGGDVKTVTTCDPDELRRLIKRIQKEIDKLGRKRGGKSNHKKDKKHKRPKPESSEEDGTESFKKPFREIDKKFKKEKNDLSKTMENESANFEKAFKKKMGKLKRKMAVFDDAEPMDDEVQLDDYTSQINRKYDKLLRENKALRQVNDELNQEADELAQFFYLS